MLLIPLPQYFTKSWPVILSAVASIMEANDPHVLAAMDGRELTVTDKLPAVKSSNAEPTAFFYIIFGLVYEALSTSVDSSFSSSVKRIVFSHKPWYGTDATPHTSI